MCRTRTAKTSLLLLVGTSVAFCFIPGFDLLGYYSCLGLGLVGGLLAGLTAVAEATAPDLREASVRARFFGATARLWPHLAAPPVILLANALRVRNCDPLEGIAFYVVGPLASMVFASQIGAGLAIVVRGPGMATLIFVATWSLSLIREVLHVYQEPQIFSFNAFAGYFSGAVYDDLITIDQRLLLFRLSNLLLLVVVWSLVGLWRSGPRMWLYGWLVLGVVGWSGFFGARAHLGVEIDRASIRQTLGGVIDGTRVSVIYDRSEIERPEAERVHRDLRYALERLDQDLDRAHKGNIEAFIYSSQEQKRALMGAGKVDLAKPWLGEIHVTRPAPGDPVLKHELAHIVLGPHGDSILGVPARASVFPHMGIVEGAAEALEWSGGTFTLHEWSAAMRREDLAPPLEEILGAGGFWNQPPGRAYTLSGSFFRWLLETRGPEPFLGVYGDGDFGAAYGESLEDLVKAWEKFLDGVLLPEHGREIGRRAFSAPGVFHRVCALEIAQIKDDISVALEEGDLSTALRLQEEILSHVPQSIDVHLAYVSLVARTGELEAITAAVRAAESVPGLDPVAASRLRELEADGRWRGGDTQGALALYRTLETAPQTLDRLRNVLVKAMICEDGDLEPILGPYLLGSAEQGDWAAYLTEAMVDLPGHFLPLYLLGRRSVLTGDIEEGSRLLRASLGRTGGLEPTKEPLVRRLVRDETRWLLGWSLVQVQRYDEAEDVLRIDPVGPSSDGRRLRWVNWANYAAWLGKKTD